MCYARYIGPERAAIEAAEARFAATLQPLTAAEARAAAVSEGLELVLSSNSETGFKGVYRKQSGKYPVTIHENGSMRYLGIFATAEEAALRYARYVGAARAAIEAAEARIAATLQPLSSPGLSARYECRRKALSRQGPAATDGLWRHGP